MHYTTVFDLAQSGYRSWGMPLYGLVFVAVGVAMVLGKSRLPAGWGRGGSRSPAFAWLWLGFAVLWTLLVFGSTWGSYSELRNAVRSHDYTVVEGQVSGFRPMPYGGHAMERFCVQDHCF